MKKFIIILGTLLIVAAVSHQTVQAGGDQVQGDKGVGEVVQDGPCPFGDDTPPGPLN